MRIAPSFLEYEDGAGLLIYDSVNQPFNSPFFSAVNFKAHFFPKSFPFPGIGHGPYPVLLPFKFWGFCCRICNVIFHTPVAFLAFLYFGRHKVYYGYSGVVLFCEVSIFFTVSSIPTVKKVKDSCCANCVTLFL